MSCNKVTIFYEKHSELESQSIEELQKYDIRNLYMRDKILEQCNEYGDVLMLVGACHFNLAELFKASGVKEVQEYYVTNSDVETIYPNLTEGCLRLENHDHIEYCKDYHFHGLLVDLYKEPDLNATQIIGQHLVLSNIINH